jgi:hypothetical protein
LVSDITIPDDAFPLTPALSLKGEGANHPLSPCERVRVRAIKIT